MPKGLVKRLQDLTLTDDKKSFLYTDVDDPKTLKEKNYLIVYLKMTTIEQQLN